MGVPYFGVLIIRILVFRVLYWDPLFLETPILKTLYAATPGFRDEAVQKPGKDLLARDQLNVALCDSMGDYPEIPIPLN